MGCWNDSGALTDPKPGAANAINWRGAGDRGGGGAWRRAWLQRDCRVREGPASGDAGAVGSVASAVLHLLCGPQQADAAADLQQVGAPHHHAATTTT